MPTSVLPRPKKVVELPGAESFRFTADTPIVLGRFADAAERLAGGFVSDAVSDVAGPAVPVERHGKLAGLAGPTVQMFLIGRDETLGPEIATLADGQDLGREGYALTISPARVLVAANSSAGLFYAAHTLVQLLRRRGRQVALPCCKIVDWPDFKYRGFMLDVSRFRVPTTETLSNLIFRLAACKINVLQLYVEHPFRCRRHPEYSEGVSPLTAEQLAELDDLCAMLHVELQANQNSLGHMHHLLKQPRFADLAELPPDAAAMKMPNGRPLPKPWSFRLDDERVYELLDDIYAEHLTAIRSPLVNLGCDEVGDMGAGRSKALVERQGRGRAFAEHVRRIAALAARYGKAAMIWDDMIVHNPEALALLPADVIPVFWHYGELPEPNYQRVWAGSGRRHWIAPGCCSWQSIASQVERAWVNIHWMTAAGRAGGAEGVLNTEWGDHGNFQTLAVSYMSIALGGELSWNSEPMTDVADFDRRFARAVFADRTGRMGRLYRTLGRTNHVFNRLPYQGPPFLLYWDEFPNGPHLAGVTGAEIARCRKQASAALKLAEQLRRDPPAGVEDSLFEELISAADQTLFACRKAELAAKIRTHQATDSLLNPLPPGEGRVRAERPAKRKPLPAALRNEVRKFAREWDRQAAEFRRVWLLSNEPSQIDYRLNMYHDRRADFAKLAK